MDFKKQVTDLKIVTATKPQVFLQWCNTDQNRDKFDCYERIDDLLFIRYVNMHNRKIVFTQFDEFFKTLEEMYQSAVTEEKPIDKVTVQNLGFALKMVGISIDEQTIDRIIDLVELIEEKGNETNFKDICEL